MNRATDKHCKKPLSQRILETLDLPAGAIGNTSFLEASGNRELIISGCESLVSYTDTCVILELCDMRLTVRGHALTLRSFLGGQIAVNGVISGIVYGTEEEHAG